MAKSSTPMSQQGTLTKTCAEQLGVSKKSLKKAVKEATVRRVAEKIAEEHFEAGDQRSGGPGKGRKRRLKNPSEGTPLIPRGPSLQLTAPPRWWRTENSSSSRSRTASGRSGATSSTRPPDLLAMTKSKSNKGRRRQK